MTKKPQAPFAPPTESEMAARSLSGLTLENLEDRVNKLRQASEPTRKARAATNKASRDAQSERKKMEEQNAKKKR
jgi:hypothetical protein